MYLSYNEGKLVIAEKIRFLSIWNLCQKNIYFDVLDDIVGKYNNLYHRTIKMKSIGVRPDSYEEYNVDSNGKDPVFHVSRWFY